MQHLTPLGDHESGLARFGLAGLQHALRHGLALEQIGVPLQLLAGEILLCDRVQVVALLGDETRALQRDKRLAGRGAVTAPDEQSGDHAGHRRADDPHLLCGDHDLDGIRQRQVGTDRDRVGHAHSEIACLRLAQLQLILRHRHGR